MSILSTLEDLLRQIFLERDLVEERRQREHKERDDKLDNDLLEMENRLMSFWEGKTVQMKEEIFNVTKVE